MMDICFLFLFNRVHIRVEENISVTAGRDGGLQSLELHGIVKLKINDEKMARVVLTAMNNDKKGVQIQVRNFFNP